MVTKTLVLHGGVGAVAAEPCDEQVGAELVAGAALPPVLLGVLGGGGEAAFDRERVDRGEVGGEPCHPVAGVLYQHPPVLQRIGVPGGSGRGGRAGPAGRAGVVGTSPGCRRPPIPRSRHPRSGTPQPRRRAPPRRRRRGRPDGPGRSRWPRPGGTGRTRPARARHNHGNRACAVSAVWARFRTWCSVICNRSATSNSTARSAISAPRSPVNSVNTCGYRRANATASTPPPPAARRAGGSPSDPPGRHPTPRSPLAAGRSAAAPHPRRAARDSGWSYRNIRTYLRHWKSCSTTSVAAQRRPRERLTEAGGGDRRRRRGVEPAIGVA